MLVGDSDSSGHSIWVVSSALFEKMFSRLELTGKARKCCLPDSCRSGGSALAWRPPGQRVRVASLFSLQSSSGDGSLNFLVSLLKTSFE